MGAVAAAVGVTTAIIDGRVAVAHAAAELAVRTQHAGVNNVRMNIAGRGAVGVLIVQRQVALVNAVQPPGRIVLSCINGHDAVFLDEIDTAVVKKSDQCFFIGPDYTTGQNLRVGLVDSRVVFASDALGDCGHGNILGAFGFVCR